MAAAKKPENLVQTASNAELAALQNDAGPRERRYGALLSMEAGVAMFAGYGRLEYRVPDDESAIPGSMTARRNKLGIKAPCIVLDNGDVIWASECAVFAQSDEMQVHLDKADQVKKATIKGIRGNRAACLDASRKCRREAHKGVPGPTAEEHAAALVARQKAEEGSSALHAQMRNIKLADLLKASGFAPAKSAKQAKTGAETTG